MKIKGYYEARYCEEWGKDVWGPYCDVIEDERKYNVNYWRYLANTLQFLDFDDVGYLLRKIEKLRNDEIEVFEYGTEIFFYNLYKDRVEFEPDFYEDWDNWTCPMEEFERALIGWREFMKMPKSEEAYIEIEINED